LGADRFGVDAEAGQDPDGYSAVVAEETEEKVLGFNAIVAQAQPYAVGPQQDVSCARIQWHLPCYGVRTSADHLRDRSPCTVGGDAKRLQRPAPVCWFAQPAV
jgi:hypothetical protein